MFVLAFIGLSQQAAAKVAITNWLNYTEKDRVSCITHDDSYLYVGTEYGGMVIINKATGEQTSYTGSGDRLHGNMIASVVKHNGKLYVGDKYWAFDVMENGRSTLGNVFGSDPRGITGFAFDSDDSLWLKSNGGIYKYDGTASMRQIPFCTKEAGGYDESIKELKSDGNNTVWTISDSFIGKMVRNSKGRLDSIAKSEKSDKWLYAFDIDKNNNLWIASGDVLREYDGAKFIDHSIDALPNGQKMVNLKIDDNGTFWILTDGNVLIKYDGSTSTAYDTKGVYGRLNCIDVDGSTVYIGSTYKYLKDRTGKEGLVKFADGTFSSVELQCGGFSADPEYAQMVDGNGDMWMMVSGDLYKAAPGEKSKLIHHFDMNGNADCEMLNDAYGKTWLKTPGTNKADFYKLEGDSAKFMVSIPSTDFSKSCFDASDKLWLVSYGSRNAMCYDGTEVKKAFSEDLSGDESLYGVCSNGSTIYFSGSKGLLMKYDGTTTTKYYPTELGDYDYNFYGITAGSNGAVWVTATVGNTFALLKFADGKWTKYDSSNTPLNGEQILNVRADKVNRVWAVSDHAINILDGDEWTHLDSTNSSLYSSGMNDVAFDYIHSKVWITTRVWSLFTSVLELPTSMGALIGDVDFSTSDGIAAASTSVSGNAKEMARYAIDGTRLSSPQHGINIVKMNDGSVRKELVK
jgi:ligand-binding sensor domain-containing protein